MLYSMPKKIQLAPSTAIWSVVSTQSVLVVAGLSELLANNDLSNSELMQNLNSVIAKAKALNIPIVDLSGADAMQGMQRLGELMSNYQQLMIAGLITPLLKQILPHLMTVTSQICIIDDAILLSNTEQHIQWIESIAEQSIHHMNSYSITRLWSLSAPTEYVLSSKGILLAVAEQLHMEALEIDLSVDLRQYGLDSVAIVSLIGLWRANGANIRYEDFLNHPTLQDLLQILTVQN
ncbi:phosphopantetheine-binding protein [Acinetobacter sp. ANC 3813]|uniref:phosphopantetheine-binding protein n=1 Tax=Acinetobacter sp. ANC 3813 TaxID=1977873 RepID=UPI000A3569D0|nr:phosphopantetheine-binding protein [Acinetobacter sp. ANC 3813]OTG91623.1 isochorismatase [Acinetobacter sp. ANC 3813]